MELVGMILLLTYRSTHLNDVYILLCSIYSRYPLDSFRKTFARALNYQRADFLAEKLNPNIIHNNKVFQFGARKKIDLFKAFDACIYSKKNIERKQTVHRRKATNILAEWCTGTKINRNSEIHSYF